MFGNEQSDLFNGRQDNIVENCAFTHSCEMSFQVVTVAFVALHLAPLGISDERRSLKTIDVRLGQLVNA